MHVAAIKGDQDGIKKLLEQGMSPNVADFAGKLHANHLIPPTNLRNENENESKENWFNWKILNIGQIRLDTTSRSM